MSVLMAVTGKRGTGKTYYTVSYLLDNHYDYNKLSDCYEKKKKHYVVTNIAGFVPEHINLNEGLKKFPKFFDIDYQYENFSNERHPGQFVSKIMVLSEAHKTINRMTPGEINFFNESRHLGWNIILDTQNISLIDRRILPLIDYEIRGVTRSLLPKKLLLYNQIESREIVGRPRLWKKSRYFDLFKSQEDIYAEPKRSNNLLKFISIALVLFIFVGYRACGTYARKAEAMKEKEAIRTGKRIEEKKKVIQVGSNLSRKDLKSVEKKQTKPKPVKKYVPPPVVPIRLNYCYNGKEVLIVMDGRLVRLKNFPYKIAYYTKTRSGQISGIYAKIPDEHLHLFQEDKDESKYSENSHQQTKTIGADVHSEDAFNIENF
jgi:hypothetical protein